MKDWLVRAIKTFVQAFFGVLIPEVVVWLTNIATINWADWKAWALPVVGAALSGGISAVWNIILEYLNETKSIMIEKKENDE